MVDEKGIFDSFLDIDSHYYINVKRLKDTIVPEFVGSYDTINEYVPVDFKMSNGLDKTIVEIKLTTNSNVVHGFETQIEEYAKAKKQKIEFFCLLITEDHI